MIFKKIFKAIRESATPKRWRSRSDERNKKKILFKILKILKFLSGNDIYYMFFDLFRLNRTYDKKYVATVSRESFALRKISKKINSRIKPKNKHHFLRMFKFCGFSLEEVNNLGFKAGNYLWKSCSNPNDRHLGGRPSLSKGFKKKIIDHFKHNSNPSSCRNSILITKKPLIRRKNDVKIVPRPQAIRELKNCQFLNNTISEIYKSFPFTSVKLWRGVPTLFPSRATFFRYKPCYFKRPRLMTDLCEYCQIYLVLKKKVHEFIKERHQNIFREKFNIDFYLTQFNVNTIELENLEFPDENEDDINSDEEENFVQNDGLDLFLMIFLFNIYLDQNEKFEGRGPIYNIDTSDHNITE